MVGELTMISGSLVAVFVAFRWLRRMARIGDILRIMSVFVVLLIAGQVLGVVSISVHPEALLRVVDLVVEIVREVFL